MGFYEIWEHYIPKSNKERFLGLYWSNSFETFLDKKGRLPRTHGISYLLVREQLKEELGVVMGFDKIDLKNELK